MTLGANLLTAADRWRLAWPGATVGALLMSGLRNPENDPALAAALDLTAADLRDRHAGATRADLLARSDLGAYAAYYRRFDKTYHVLLQLESVVFKGKPLQARGALVGAMFRAELQDGLLTAGHDADLVSGELTVDVVEAGDVYVGMGGATAQASSRASSTAPTIGPGSESPRAGRCSPPTRLRACPTGWSATISTRSPRPFGYSPLRPRLTPWRSSRPEEALRPAATAGRPTQPRLSRIGAATSEAILATPLGPRGAGTPMIR
jgi:hypothetical protein